MNILKPVRIKRTTKEEVRYHPKMGTLNTEVTRIQKMILGFPFKTLYAYRTTYHGKVKDCTQCNPAVI